MMLQDRRLFSSSRVLVENYSFGLRIGVWSLLEIELSCKFDKRPLPCHRLRMWVTCDEEEQSCLQSGRFETFKKTRSCSTGRSAIEDQIPRKSLMPKNFLLESGAYPQQKFRFKGFDSIVSKQSNIRMRWFETEMQCCNFEPALQEPPLWFAA